MEASSSPDPIAHQPLVRRTTASSILAKFLPGVRTEHKMDTQRGDKGLRAKTPVKYAESETSSAPMYTPASQRYIDLTDNDSADDEEAEFQIVHPPQPPKPQQDEAVIEYARPSRAGLRARKPNMSLKASENAFNSLGRARPKKSDYISDLVGADVSSLDLTPVVSKRVAIRQEIASKTAAYRNRFLIDKKDFWLPLLPPHNYVRKLVENHEQLPPAEIAKLPTVAPYEEIERQPRGIKAVMKPYQLSGLSFMVYLHRNVRCLPINCKIEADYIRVCLAF
jgi:hypothetical protein